MNSKEYQPEIGQRLFGNPTYSFACPEFVTVGLRYLSCEIQRVMMNKTQRKYESPMHNNGSRFDCDAFKVRAYCWGEHEETAPTNDCSCNKPNFEYGTLGIKWYKYLGRGMSMNKEIDANQFFKIIDDCLAALRKLDTHDE